MDRAIAISGRSWRACVPALGLTLAGIASAATDCDTTRGGEAFATKCAVCHSLEAGRHLAGPSLQGLAGRAAGTVPGFNFSAAMSASGIEWNAATLAAFLASPQTYIRGTVMPFGGIRNPAERSALVCYLVPE
ncbi:MAG: c-type cytochrome [Gammaproteobacteria bacterium]|nr:c-type cytochrome [Gammaproteobacteria bacterium]